MNKHIPLIIGISILFSLFFCQELLSQKPTTVAASMIYDFNYFNTNKKVQDYYTKGFNNYRKNNVSALPSGAYGIEFSYAFSKKWMGAGGILMAHYNYEIKPTTGFNNSYGFRLFSTPITFKYYPLQDEEYLYIQGGIQVGNILEVYGVEIQNSPTVFIPGINYINKFQPGYVIGTGYENHSSKKYLFAFGIHYKTKFNDLSDQYLNVNHAGEVLTAVGMEVKMGYRFHGARNYLD